MNLTKIFHDSKRGAVLAADHLNFECTNGEIFGLLGPNGAGKTTTLRLLATILEPTEGTAIVGNYDIVSTPEKVRSQIGYLTGDTGLYDNMTPKELVRYFGLIQGGDPNLVDRRLDELFGILGISEFANTKINKLSTGMKQKVSIARTIIHDPPVLIFDEPTAGLDVLTAHTLMEYIYSLKKHGKCIIYSTHIMSEAERLCDRIGIIHKGKIVDIGSLNQLKERYDAENLEQVFFHLVKSVDDSIEVEVGL